MSLKSSPVIHWFRQDLRLSGNPAFGHAASSGNVIPVYIIGPDWKKMGGASKWWLAKSLHALNEQLNGSLSIVEGEPAQILPTLAKLNDCDEITWSRRYEPEQIADDKKTKQVLEEAGLNVKSLPSFLLWEPWKVLKDDGSDYRVFTAFYKKCLKLAEPNHPSSSSAEFVATKAKIEDFETFEASDLTPQHWDLAKGTGWKPGEKGAQENLHDFLQDKVISYKKARDYPELEATSCLSPHLHFGEISPHQVWYAAKRHSDKSGSDQGIEHFLKD
ncbi:deoxyribodipyrimidine photo-lyase [Sneathiella glossodoripedis]|uniref:deoxyribodipyrimidine photo-lyase n=1 Tax=Sneathiella glossodoripedis TaxID=418853 RepID=UPI000AD79A34|nr:deoxyribodipyrimidine photo-lyase [Sneathiella glossodoripedis]